MAASTYGAESTGIRRSALSFYPMFFPVLLVGTDCQCIDVSSLQCNGKSSLQTLRRDVCAICDPH
eukprot:2129571-Amphidinium_carterae.1